jgi:hypothetical protein
MPAPENMPFDGALWALKRGARMQRRSWNAPGQWVALVAKPSAIRMPLLRYTRMDPLARTGHADIAAHDIQPEPFFILCNAQGRYVAWVPSIGDILAEDWQEWEP